MIRRWGLADGAAILAIGFIVLFVGGGSRHAIGLVLKPMAEALNWERSTIGAAVALFLVVSAACMFFAGHLADRYPLHTILGGGLLASAAGIGLMGAVSEPWHMFVLYGIVFAVGNGVASITPIGVMVTRRFPKRVGLANAFAISGMGLGQLIIIAVLTTVLIGLGWRSVYVWLGLINLALAPLVIWALKTGQGQASAPVTAAPSGLSLREAVRTRYFWLLILVYGLCGFQDFFVSTHVVAFALDQGLTTLLAGNLLALLGFVGLIGVLLSGMWSDRFGPIAATVFCFALRAVMFVAVLIYKDTAAIALFAVMFGLTFWITAPLTVVFVRNAFGEKSLGALSGFVTMVHHICGGLGALFGAAVFDADGSYDACFALMAGCALAGGVLSLGLVGRQHS